MRFAVTAFFYEIMKSVQAKTNRNLLIVIVILAVFSISLSAYARWINLFPADLRSAKLLQSFINPALTNVMKWISIVFTGWPACLIIIFTGAVLLWRLGKLEGVFIWTAGVFSIFSEVFKILIARPRPTGDQVKILMNESGYGFPSGHAFFSILFLGMLAYLLSTNLKNRGLRIASLIILTLLILLIGISRVYLGDHWPSDVLGGYVIGGLLLAFLILIYNRLKPVLYQTKLP